MIILEGKLCPIFMPLSWTRVKPKYGKSTMKIEPTLVL